MTEKAKNFALMATIESASNYDETKAAISSQNDKTIDMNKKSSFTSSVLEIEDPSADTRKQKRRKGKRGGAVEAAPRPGTGSSKSIQ